MLPGVGPTAYISLHGSSDKSFQGTDSDEQDHRGAERMKSFDRLGDRILRRAYERLQRGSLRFTVAVYRPYPRLLGGGRPSIGRPDGAFGPRMDAIASAIVETGESSLLDIGSAEGYFD